MIDIYYVRVNSNGRNPREFDFSKKYGQISDSASDIVKFPTMGAKNIVRCPYLPRTFPI